MHTTRDRPLPKADPTWKVGIIHSAWYPELVGPMVHDAKTLLKEAGIGASNILVHEVAGSFEIPLIGSVLAQEKKVDALIALGVIVKGETQHADLIAQEIARGVMNVQLVHGVPFAFEVLYVDDLELAKRRGDKGKAAAYTTLHSLAALQRIAE